MTKYFSVKPSSIFDVASRKLVIKILNFQNTIVFKSRFRRDAPVNNSIFGAFLEDIEIRV